MRVCETCSVEKKKVIGMKTLFLVFLLGAVYSASAFPFPQDNDDSEDDGGFIFFPTDDEPELSFEDRVKERLPPRFQTTPRTTTTTTMPTTQSNTTTTTMSTTTEPTVGKLF